MNKITKDQIEEIKELRKQGLSSYQIADKLGLPQSTVFYQIKEKKPRSQHLKEYQKQYHKKRYQTDEVFKAKQIAATIKSRRKNNGTGTSVVA